MTQSDLDPQRLAALLEGRVSDPERGELLAQLAKSPDALSAFSDAAAVTSELDAAPQTTAVRPISARKNWRRLASGKSLAIAAVIAGILIIPSVIRRPLPEDPGEFALLLENRGRTVPELQNPRPWRTTRSGSVPLTSAAVAWRVGAYVTDLELTVVTSDTATRALAADVVRLLEDVPAAGMASGLYSRIATGGTGNGTQTQALLRDARLAVARVLDGRRYRLGAWVEAARVGAGARDEQFFRRPPSQRAIAELTRELPESAQPAISELRSALSAVPVTEWQRPKKSLDEIMAIGGQ